MTRTKIICTIGPSVDSVEKITQLIEAGMNVARLNFSHGSHAEHLERIENVKKARAATNQPIAILLDTKGPEIRLGKVQKGGIEVHAKSTLWLVKKECLGTSTEISITPPHVLDLIPIGTHLLIDNGYISAHVIETSSDGILIQFENHGHITSSKGVNIPNIDLMLPALTEKDIADIRFGCENDIDIIAASFVRNADHVLTIKKLLADQNMSDVVVLAKIENNEGIINFDSILHVADGIMIARGDLGVEIPLSKVPKLQKMMIRKCNLIGKPSVTATQMLESMISNPRPTRAEASDVANAIYDSTSAVMLSGETAVGAYPIQTVQIMKSIISEAEQDFNHEAFFEQHTKMEYHDIPPAITLAAVKTAASLNVKAIFAFTHGGTTARLLSRLRPIAPIIAFTSKEKTYYQLATYWGVTSVLCNESSSIDNAFKEASDYALKKQFISHGDLVLLTSGSPFWVSGTTNTLRVESIGDVLVRGYNAEGAPLQATCIVLPSAESKKSHDVQGQILVISNCDDSYIPLIQEAAGVILENALDDKASEQLLLALGKSLDKTVLTRADGAFRVLHDGMLVTIDPAKALVYKGAVQ